MKGDGAFIISTYAPFTSGNVFDILNGFEKSKV